MDFQRSRFVVEDCFDDGVLMMATSTGAVIKLNGRAYDDWRVGNWQSLGFDKLLEWKFIVPGETDEWTEQATIRKVHSTKKLNLVIAPTLECNARCWYCYEEGCKQSRMDEGTISKVSEFVRDMASNYESLKIMWFGGEPLMASDIIDSLTGDFIGLTSQYSASIATNGSLMDKKVADKLSSWRVNHIQIPLDGPEAMTNETKRYRNRVHNYKTVMENVQYVLEEYNDIAISIRVNFSRINADTLPELWRELDPMMKKYSQLSAYVAPVLSVSSNAKDVVYGADEASQIVMRYAAVSGTDKAFGRIADRTRPRSKACMRQDECGLVIDPHGYLYRCEHFIGNTEMTAGDVWSGIEQSVDYSLPPQCESCPLVPLCQGGCIGMEGDNIGRCAMLREIVSGEMMRLVGGGEKHESR